MTSATAGAVLTGGASSRMGRDKATIVVDGEPMAARVAATLAAAGCAPVWFQGGDPAVLAPIAGQHRIVDDRAPGSGPVGAIASALHTAAAQLPGVVGVVIAACDLFALDAKTVQNIVAAGRDGGVVVASTRQDSSRHLLSWWSTRLAEPVAAVFASGVTSYRGLLDALGGDDSSADFRDDVPGALAGRVVAVEVPPNAVRNANAPSDLPSESRP